MPNAIDIAKHADWFIDNNENHLIWREATDWSIFGKNISFDGSHVTSDVSVSFPPNSIEEEYYNKEKSYVKEIINAFEVSTSHYLNIQNVKKNDSWIMMYPAICRYDVTTEENYRGEGSEGPLAMTYHTDYEILKAEQPGNKFVLTCTVYLNDDYEGGEIEFLANGEVTVYKPKAGDVVVFPSGHPNYFSEEFTYYHGVRAITNGKKFFLRIFWTEPYAGSEEWLANQAKYGEEVWAEMEKARIVAGMRTHEATMREINIQKPVTLEDLGIDPEKECGLEEFRKSTNE